jgi:class 3 adenylate cyclase/pimeloyl-ACP methyl ester carboxylesterase
MVVAPGTVSHLDLAWEWPVTARYIERLSSFCRLIRFDKRGTGLSDRPTNAATLEERIDDIRAVMDAAGSEEAVIFGGSEGGSMACLFAATYPIRTRALILWGVLARWIKSEDYPWGLTPEENQRMVDDLQENGVTLRYLTGTGAGLGKDVDPAYLEFFLRLARAGGSPSAVAALEQMNAEIDTRDILPTIHAPTLVMNRTGDPLADIKGARDLASRIPGAKFVEFPGNSHSMAGIQDQVVSQIEEFVTGSRPRTTSDRVLATILFIDIVGSTETAAKMGDTEWRDLLNTHNDLVRRELVSHRGNEIKTTGDGFLATFDGPTRAIECAIAIRESVGKLGIRTRAGLHTGECELMEGDIGGIAVHMASRVTSQAGPGEILVSSTVKDLVARSGLEFVDRGSSLLKDFGERRLFAVI